MPPADPALSLLDLARPESGPAAGDILVVDDNPANLIAIEAALGELSGQVVRAQSGAEALRTLLERDFAVILLDVKMPSLDGYQTAQLIRDRKRSRHTPIIFVTAFGREDEEVLAAYELGAVDFLFKPIRPEVLRAKVRVFVELQRRTAEVARQAELLRAHERRALEQALDEERRRWEEESLRRQRDEAQRAAEALAHKAEELAREIALREQAQRELQRTNAELAQSDRRKDEFLAMLGHELRNPLAPLAAGLEIMRRGLPAGGPASASLERMRAVMDRQVRHLSRLVDDLLDVSRINSGKIELRKGPAVLQDIIQQAITTSRPLMEEKNHHLSVDLPRDPVTLQVDSVRVTQVVANLLNNAARYTDEGGRIAVVCASSDQGTVIRVRDNGRGISADLLPRVFDLFVQAKDGGSGGLGLGLTLVRRLVELHHGTVEAHSDGPGRGSEFVVHLPPDARTVAPEPVGAAAATPGPSRRLRIVLVEDNDDIRETLRDLLSMWDHAVDVAADGEEGARLILAKQPDVAIVDVGLPVLDGYQVAGKVRSESAGRRVKLVAMTGYGQESDRRKALEAGFDAHLVKPASADDLLALLNQG